MNRDEIKRIIRDEIRIALQVIASGEAGDNSALTSEDINQLFPGLPPVVGRPIMRPYGFMSRAPLGTISVTAQQGEHPGNKVTLGHRDDDVPSVNEGETKIYEVDGHTIYLSNTAIMLGKNGGTFYTAVLGEALATLINSLITAILNHTHPFLYNAGSTPTTGATQVLSQASSFNSLKTDTFLAEDGKGL